METKIAANEQAATSNLFAEETEDIKREATESSLDRDGGAKVRAAVLCCDRGGRVGFSGW